MPALYDIHKSWAANLTDGPGACPVPSAQIIPEEQWIEVLGYRVKSRLGVPAGPLLNSQWTTLAARLGFDIVTYKTIRSQLYLGHPLPNVIFVQSN